ncbi:DUF2637 domain-containing protein [Streptomyces sp. CB03911]|uniref:DUF2637 domain-containing protein n=1 Tax=Streptomyces sp. CB03911 TaxID=1804758 RepID=UPI000939D4A3|nr:DUF2637 domain-containing protein [Streptomyces sp. CB03911]OKI16609.1 hypothetical protein A6A07_11415 [Streptomyces sp. CB03911]
MTEPDLSTDRWLPITSVLPPATPQPKPAADKRIQRMTARAAEKRANRHDALQLRAEERRTLREERSAARTEARELRAEKRADRTESAHRAKDRATALGRGVLVTGPILAPMAVAWTGQSQFAIQILGWAFAASVLYAAAYELTTVYWAWLYHQARTDGDSGWEYRLGTWVFAAGAAVQQWWHYSDHWAATPRAVTYSVMSAVGVLLWEGRARLIHRRKMRAENKLAPARPRIGVARWVRYPVRSWTAWSLITLEGHQTLDAAWTAADTAVRSRKTDRTDRTGRRSTWWAVQRTDEPDRKSPAAVDRPGRTTLPVAGPDRAAAVRTEHVDLTESVRTTRRGPDRASGTGPRGSTGPDHTDRTGMSGTDRQRTAGSSKTDRTAPAGDVPSTDLPPADRTEADLVLNETEQAAIDLLQAEARSISKRSIADTVRAKLGRSIASDRAAEIARHYRTLRSAA